MILFVLPDKNVSEIPFFNPVIDIFRARKWYIIRNKMSEKEERNKIIEETVSSDSAAGSAEAKTAKKEEKASGSKIPLIIAGIILVLAALVFLFIKLSPETIGRIRDITLIIYALASIVTIAALVVFVIQAARFVNFLKYEISPILHTTDKTVKKLSGTVSFLCENAVEPTVKAASTLSGVKSTANSILSIFKK